MRKVLIIGNPGIGSTVAKKLAQAEGEIIFTREMSEKEIQRKLESDMIYKDKQSFDTDFIPEEKPSFGKSKKQMRNNRNPQRIKAKYKGKFNPFNKK